MIDIGGGVIGLFQIAFFAVFFIVLAIIVVTVIRSITRNRMNLKQPRIAAPAKVISRRTSVSTSHTNGTYHSSSFYYMTFEFRTGDRCEYLVPEDVYGYFTEGDDGTLTVQGSKFISFAI